MTNLPPALGPWFSRLALVAGLVLALVFGLAGAAWSQGEGTPYQDDIRRPGEVQRSPADVGLVAPASPGLGAEMWRDMRSGESGQVLVLDPKAGILIQAEGETWRRRVGGTVKMFGAWLLLLSALTVAVLYVVRGRTPVRGRSSRRMVERFTRSQRVAHWLTAISFIVLGLTGLNLTYGKAVLMPLMGADRFATLTLYGKYVHNLGGLAFVIGLGMLALLWFPGSRTAKEVLKARAKANGRDGFTGKYNWLQKASWALFVLGGALMVVSGAALLFPFVFDGRAYAGFAEMQQIQLAHAILGLLLIAAVLGHLYYDVLSKRGTVRGILTGRVSEAWARQHHGAWLESVRQRNASNAPTDEPSFSGGSQVVRHPAEEDETRVDLADLSDGGTRPAAPSASAAEAPVEPKKNERAARNKNGGRARRKRITAAEGNAT